MAKSKTTATETKKPRSTKPKKKEPQLDPNLEVVHHIAAKVRPNPYNPNVQQPRDFSMLLGSIAEEGFNQPVIVVKVTEEHLNVDPKIRAAYKKGDTVIVDGEHRWRAWAVLNYLVRENAWNEGKPDPDVVLSARDGAEQILKDKLPNLTIPVVFVELTPDQMRVATLRRNRARGNEDQDLLSAMFKDLEELGSLAWVGDALKMSQHEIDSLVRSATEVLAGDEFSEAWEPAPDDTVPEEANDPEDGGPGTGGKLPKKARKIESETPDAKKAIDTGRGKTELFTLHLVFYGSEADLVRAVLAEGAASKVVDWCKAASDSIQESLPSSSGD